MRSMVRRAALLAVATATVVAVGTSGFALAQTPDDGGPAETTASPAAGQGVDQERRAVDRGRRGADRARRGVTSAIAEFLGMTRDEFRTELRAGRTIAEIAESQGSSGDAVRVYLLDELAARLDKAVANERITAERRDTVLDAAERTIEERINAEHSGRDVPGERRRAERRRSIGARAAAVLGIEYEELRSAITSGATVGDVIEEQGLTDEDFVDGMMVPAVERADEAVAAGKVDREAADERLAKMRQRLEDRVSTGR